MGRLWWLRWEANNASTNPLAEFEFERQREGKEEREGTFALVVYCTCFVFGAV